MNNIKTGLVILFCLFLQVSCHNKPKDSKQKAVELMSTQTLGLAYLEEFKLPEAEKEFKKFIKLSPDDKLGYANLGLTYLRMGRYPDAEKQLLKAINIAPKDPDIRLLLATVYQMNDQRKEAISQLKEALTFAPDHSKLLYFLSELYAAEQTHEAQKERFNYLLQLVQYDPGNLVPHLDLIDLYIKKGESDKALEQMELIRKQFPEFPKEAMEYYNKVMPLLRKGDNQNALVQYTIFYNYLKVSAPYQAGMIEFKGPGGSLVGFPLISYDQQPGASSENKSILDVIKFTNVTATSGLNIIPSGAVQDANTIIATSDYDNDGDEDLYIGSYDPATSSYRHWLFNNDMGAFKDVSQKVGIKHSGKESYATFADYDNDGFMDLYIVKENGDVLYRNAGKGFFEDVTLSSKVGNKSGGRTALFLDADHDGDLDLYETNAAADQLFRNNGDGTFQEQAQKMGLTASNSRDVVFGDFEDNGVIDLFTVNEQGHNILFSNQRQGTFRDVTTESGLKVNPGSSAAVVGDYNNDGFQDLLITSDNGGNQILYKNLGNGKFEEDKKAEEVFAPIRQYKIHDAVFFDFDNDGYLDILLVGEGPGRGVFLYHNNGKGIFSDESRLLPEEPKSGRQIRIFDYNEDGDPDILIAGTQGGVYLLRNDGGNMNHYIKMKLVGLRAGSAKNNHFGIGAKVEIRAGDLYQSMIVTNPNLLVGLGNRRKADVIRITWTNGVPQNIFLPGSDQALIEAQTLKGSCPFLYTWDGSKYEFAKDILWRSALGMPLGIMGSDTKYGFPEASDDYIKISGNQLKDRNGSYSMQITSELWETIYFDKLDLVAVDHPDSLDFFVPEQFSPPPFPGMKIYQVKKKILPLSAVDSKGNNVLSFITEKDDKYLADFSTDKYQGTAEEHELILDPGKAGASGKLLLYLTGWVFPTDASINVALMQSAQFKAVPPVIQVLNKKGEWETVADNVGFPMGKDKTVVVDLTGKFPSMDHRIRIRTSMEVYWDQIFFSEDNPEVPFTFTDLQPAKADLHYRGFSRLYRKGGRYGPHWFDYSSVDKNRKWHDLTGNYTHYGDVLPLLKESDNQYIISNAGDETTIEFDAKNLPELKKGWRRDFLIHSVGWVKDGDLNTATGNTVLPLPFHGMKSYPPAANDAYPNTPELQQYNRTYNTRSVKAEDYHNALVNK